MAHVATLIPLFALLGFAFILMNGRNMSERAIGIVGTTAIGASFVASVVVFFQLLGRSDRQVTVHLFNWIDVGTLRVPAALLVDPLSITMCLFVTGISTLIHLYSTGYMHGEKDFRKFFTYLNLFVFSMLVLALSSSGRLTIAIIGGVTAFVAATIATSQKDIKKVLAFSTVSQIGYMVLAVGVGAYGAAIFLMIAHAFFKALLFLGSGSVIHSLNGEQDMRKMGALARFLPWTFPTFLIGWLTISGIPPLAGFWSKGDILANAYDHSKPLWLLGVITAILTAYYMTRLFVLTFRGNERFREVTHGHDPHESPWVMTLPLVILAVFSVLGGVIDLPWIHHDSLSNFLSPAFGYVAPGAHEGTALQLSLALIDVAAALIGIVASFSIWRNIVESKRYEKSFLEHVWRWDDFYDATIGRPLTEAAVFTNDVVEPEVIDGAVTGVAVAVRRSGEGLRKVQSGFVRHYALATVLGVAVMIVYLVARVA